MRRSLAIILLLFAADCLWAQSGDVVISTNTTWAAGTYNLSTLHVTNGATLTLASANNAAQVNGTWAGYGVTINAASITVDVNSYISADAHGYLGGDTNASGAGPGGGAGSILYNSTGGSYGGLGTDDSGALSPGPIYGLPLQPTDLGSGAGGTTTCAGGVCGAANVGGNGGGAIRLAVAGTLTLNGVISANGGLARPNWPPDFSTYAGGGSGGSIWVTAAKLTGSGRFTADGAVRWWGTVSTVPSGGGGRIAVYFGEGKSFTGYNLSSANGGPAAQRGTVAFFDTTTSSILVDGGQAFPYPEDSNLAFKDITVRGGATLSIGGGSFVASTGLISVGDNSRLVLQGKNTREQVGGVWAGSGVTLAANNVTIESNGFMTASGEGYQGGATGGSGRGPGGGQGSDFYDSAGGSYGGRGFSSASLSSGPTYGDEEEPTDLGSGGGGATIGAGGSNYLDPAGGNGGGAIRLLVNGTLTVNGVLSADGISGSQSYGGVDNYAGGGSGGSLWINAAKLTGIGQIIANGGPRMWGGEPVDPSGGGGRVAVYYSTSDFDRAHITASPGAAGAEPGTVVYQNGLKLISPNGGETLIADKSYTISWQYNGGLTGSVKLVLYQGAAVSRIIAASTPIGTDGHGSYTWTIPKSQLGMGGYTVRVSTLNQPYYVDYSDAPFTIANLQVSSPNGGETWSTGMTYPIQWTYFGLTGNVKLVLYKAGEINTVVSPSVPIGTDGSGSFNWTLPATLLPGADYTMRVSTLSNPLVVDFSDAKFTIATGMKLLTPNGGENWAAGSRHAITWQSAGISGRIKLVLYKAGAIHTVVTSSWPITAGSYTWTVPMTLPLASDYTMRISTVVAPYVVDFSDAPFSVSGGVQVVVPNGGESWTRGTTSTIRWNFNGITGNVKLVLYKSSELYGWIATLPVGANGSGSYDWNIPTSLPPGSDYTMRVSSLSPVLVDFSDARFSIN